MALELKDVIWCDSCLLRFHPIFRSHYPTDRTRFLLFFSHNAFRAMIEIDPSDRVWHVKLHPIPSDSPKSHTIVRLCATTAKFSNRSVKPTNNRVLGRWLKSQFDVLNAYFAVTRRSMTFPVLTLFARKRVYYLKRFHRDKRLFKSPSISNDWL